MNVMFFHGILFTILLRRRDAVKRPSFFLPVAPATEKDEAALSSADGAASRSSKWMIANIIIYSRLL